MNPTISIKEVSAISIHSARCWIPQPREAIISITGTGEPRARLKKGWAHTLRLCFDDIEAPFFNRRIFTEEDADKVIDFIDRIEGEVDHVVVHCTHGQSGSPAIARYITQRYDPSNWLSDHRTFNRHVFKTLFVRWRHRVEPGQGYVLNMGWTRPDDPMFQVGPIIAGIPLTEWLGVPPEKATDEDKVAPKGKAKGKR
jgi:predicted protein tyrosine phosphatase